MIGPSWLADVFAAAVIAVALFSAARLIASRGRRRKGEVDADGVHVLMGVAMAGMFVPRLATLPSSAWGVIFAAGAAWFGWRTVQVRRGRLAGPAGQPRHLGSPGHCCPYPAPHLIDCAAMLYMLWAVSTARPGGGAAAGGMSGMAAAAGTVRLPALGLILVLLICGYVVWLGDRIQLLSPARAAVRPGDAAVLTGTGAAAGSLPAAGSVALIASPATARPAMARAFLAPRAATCGKIAMGVAMALMLVDLL